jgi:tetratricopeptide (TPR) repeat protein
LDHLEISTTDIDIGAAIDEGLRLCRAEEWQVGLGILWKIARKQERSEKLPPIYYSYAGYGAARFDGNVKEGLSLCRHAIKLDPLEPDNYLNLARVEMLRRNRRSAIKALRRGLTLRPGHPRLAAFEREIGSRRRPVIPFLSRDNRLNMWLGRRRHLRELER